MDLSRSASQARRAEPAGEPVPWPVALAAVSFLCAWAFFVRWRFLCASPFPLGVDGYYYPVQLRSILESGTLYYRSAPLALYLMAPLAAAFGPIAGAKVGAALFSALLALPVYALGRRSGGGRAAGVLAAAVVATSPSSFYLSTEFVKNGAGLAIAATALLLLCRALEAPSAARTAAAVAGFVATLLAHKLAFALLLLFAAPPLLLQAKSLSPRAKRAALAAGAASLVAVAVAGLLWPRRFAGAADLSLLADLFRARADWSLPVLDAGRPLAFHGEVWLAGGLGLAALVALLVRRHASSGALAVGPAALALLGALPWIDVSDPQGPGFRLRLCVFLAAALCAPLCARVAGRPLARRWRALLCAAAAALCFVRPVRYTEPVIRANPAMVKAVENLAGRVPEEKVVIVSERHILFMVAWYTRLPARLRPEPVEPARRVRLFPLAFMSGALRSAVDRARSERPPGVPAPRSLHPLHPDGLVLVPEVTWRWILGQLPPREQERYRRWPVI